MIYIFISSSTVVQMTDIMTVSWFKICGESWLYNFSRESGDVLSLSCMVPRELDLLADLFLQYKYM